MVEELEATLFREDGEHVYAVIDGASCEDLVDQLLALKPENFCLYAGDLEPDVAEAAPYLVELLPGHPFTAWFLAEGAGKHWGVFARSSQDLRALRKHFRGFLLVKDADGKTLYFRYYDPRVLSLYLPAAGPKDLEAIFGPVSSFVCEAGADRFHTYRRQEEGALENVPWPKIPALG